MVLLAGVAAGVLDEVAATTISTSLALVVVPFSSSTSMMPTDFADGFN